jgi:hypothetical protein
VIISHGLENRYANYGSKIVNSLSGMWIIYIVDYEKHANENI